jgi:hypothetical protein
LQRFLILSHLAQKKYSGKTERWKNLKLCIQVIALHIHQMVHRTRKNISSHVMSKNLSEVPLRKSAAAAAN